MNIAVVFLGEHLASKVETSLSGWLFFLQLSAPQGGHFHSCPRLVFFSELASRKDWEPPVSVYKIS